MHSTDTGAGRSLRRDLALRLGVVAVAIALGLVSQHLLAGRLAQIDELSKRDLLGARAQFATLLRFVAVGLFGLTGAVGACMIASCRRALALAVYPPPGVWSWGRVSRRVFTGASAQRIARVGLGLGALLVALSAAGGGLLWYAAAVVASCRAGVP